LVLDEPKDTDESYEINGLTYLIDKKLAITSGNIKVDFVNNGWKHGFMISTAKPIITDNGGCNNTSCSC